MFKPVIRANKNRKVAIKSRSRDVAKENGWIFTEEIESNALYGAAYTAEFVSADSPDPFYGWVIASVNNGEWQEEIDIVFGAGQNVFTEYIPLYVITDEDYYETIGAGI